MLANHILQTVTTEICRKFPEVAGCQPRVQLQPVPKGALQGRPDQYLLIYRGFVESPTGQRILRMVRVVVNAQGKVIKVSTSR